MDPFENVTRTVTRHNDGLRKGAQPVKEMYARDFFGDRRRGEEDAKLDEAIAEKSRNIAVQESMSDPKSNFIAKGRIRNRVNEIREEAKTEAFTQMMLEMYNRCLTLDEDFKAEKSPQIENFIRGYVTTNNGYQLMENALRANPSNELLKKMDGICKEYANEVADNLYEFAMENDCAEPADLEMTFDDEDRTALACKIDKLDGDKLADAVKDKVISVIKDEKERQMEKEQEMGEFDKLSDEEQANMEALMVMHGKRNTPTLFEAIMRNSYRELLQTSVKESAASMDFADDGENEDPGTMKEENEYHMDATEEASINMDMVLADAVSQYTLLEMVNTLQLEKFDQKTTERLIHNLTR